MNVNAIKNFFFKLRGLKDSLNPDYIVFANDLSREKTFRRKLFKGYKAQRKPKDDDILEQMKYIQQITSLLGFPFINDEEYEADDVLGMISRLGIENDMDTVIVSSDRDLYQLLNDRVFIYSFKDTNLLDCAWLDENYRLTPEQWIELKILQGDRSDNIPGVDGIGEVTALKLLQHYNSIDEIYKHLGYLKPKTKILLENGRNVLDLTRELVTIITDYHKLNLTIDSLNRNEVYTDEIFQTLDDLEVNLDQVMRYSLLHGKIE
jgi:hypothetical protein ELI_0933